jgi:hypothetical protein
MKSALFLDFDNVYSGLRKLDPASADRFARQPMRWVQWLLNDLPAPEHAPEGARRRLLVRRVYLNPQVYQRYRPAFNHAGFEIIDCPAMTSEGKTSTDIHMVLDMVDLLQHEVHVDEFIVFSADADFTPVLRKLRRWDRRTTVLAVGFPSAAYRASADLLIDQDVFVRDAVGRSDDEVPGRWAPAPALASTANAGLAAALASPSASGPSVASGAAWTSAAAPTASPPPASPPSASLPNARLPNAEAVAEGLRRVVALVQAEVARADRPVPVARLASQALREHPWLAEDWHGSGSFRRFLESLPLDGLVLDWTHSGGHVLDAARMSAVPEHAVAEAPVADWGLDAATLAQIRQVHNNTNVPLISPRAFRGLMDAIVADVAEAPFQLSDTGKRVRDRCRSAGLDINREQVNWVLRGLLLSGHEFGQGRDDVPTLSYKLVGHLINLCRREQMPMEDVQASVLQRWVSGLAPLESRPDAPV